MAETGYILTIERLRTATDGDGITTLVGMDGCPLRCRYCLNDYCHDGKAHICSPKELLEKVRIDNIYFHMSGGGITFGGGEPLLQSTFIKEFALLCDPGWKIRIETCLNVPWKNIEPLIPIVNLWIIDIKDADPIVYRKYTDADNTQVLENLGRLYDMVGPEKLWVRVPLIQGYNDSLGIQKTLDYLKPFRCRKECFEYQISK